MALIEWRKEFETGVADVDHEHRELVDLINRLHESIASGADRSRITEFLGEVFARIAAHFALEESIMRKHAYDEYEAHKAEHEKLLDEIRDIMDAQQDNPSSAYEEGLSLTVRDWFVNHFKSKDARLHKQLGV
ncbi:MAG: bacteriohemerythrin [Aestuariivirga sp.]|jgi:hemerythrin